MTAAAEADEGGGDDYQFRAKGMDGTTTNQEKNRTGFSHVWHAERESEEVKDIFVKKKKKNPSKMECSARDGYYVRSRINNS